MKSPFDVEDAKLDASSAGTGPGGGPPVLDLEARPSALGSALSQRLSALGHNLSHRISYLSHQMDEHGLTRISAVKVMAEDKDTVTEPGRGALLSRGRAEGRQGRLRACFAAAQALVCWVAGECACTH